MNTTDFTDIDEELKRLVIITMNSSICEIRTTPKPGNVHKFHDFPNTKYEDFLTAVYNLEKDWNELGNEIIQDDTIDEKKLPSILGQFYHSSVKNMMEVQSGGNVLLGHIMLMAPLFISAIYCIKNQIKEMDDFWKICSGMIQNSTADDTINLYKALRIAQPGGMGIKQKYDIFSSTAFDELSQDKINLSKIFEISKDYDSISHELATNYSFIKNEILPKINRLQDEYGERIDAPLRRIKKKVVRFDVIKKWHHFNEFIIRIYIYILSVKPDTLIIRKNNGDLKAAEEITSNAKNLYDSFFYEDLSIWMCKIQDFDEKLQKENGKHNPGATADLLACSLYIMMLNEIFNYD